MIGDGTDMRGDHALCRQNNKSATTVTCDHAKKPCAPCRQIGRGATKRGERLLRFEIMGEILRGLPEQLS